jgi:UTP--glucose-1-phosphate uridylyltransferase
MSTIVEKPGKETAPSNLASVGGYLLTPDIFAYLEKSQSDLDENEEFQVQPAMRAMIQDGKPLFASAIKGAKYYDTGNKLEYVKTVVDFALQHDDIKDEFLTYLKSLSV